MRSKDILIISVFSLITITVWIALDVYHASVISTLKPEQEQIIKPLTPNIDAKIIDNIRLRQK
jgi:hypothetical protein